MALSFAAFASSSSEAGSDHGNEQKPKAMAAIFSAVALMGISEYTHRKYLRSARDDVMHEPTRFGPILQEMKLVTTSGGVKHVPVAHPFASLWTALTESASFATLFRSRLQINPSTPENLWNIILYSDEVTPGDPLAHDNKRKFQAIYRSQKTPKLHKTKQNKNKQKTQTKKQTKTNNTKHRRP